MAKLQITKTSLAPMGPFQGVNLGVTQPLGKILLPVMFGTKENYRTENIIFDVADIAMPYNGILGRPALAKFMAITHHAYNLVKMPGSAGTLTVHGDIKDAVRSIEHAYKEAAASQPVDKNDVEQLAEVSKTKQLFSQERAAKRRSL